MWLTYFSESCDDDPDRDDERRGDMMEVHLGHLEAFVCRVFAAAVVPGPGQAAQVMAVIDRGHDDVVRARRVVVGVRWHRFVVSP